MPGSDGAVMLPLNGFLLRRRFTPANAWTDTAAAEVELFYWAEGRIEPLEIGDAEILEAAVPGDIFIALLRRLSSPPVWQVFMREALGLVDFGSVHESLGAAVFCAASSDVDGGQLRWVVWTFGNAGRALRRSAEDPRFGLLAVLNLLVVPLMASEQSMGVARQRRRGPQLREMRYRTTSPYVQQTGHRAARDIPIDGFRVDRTSDLVAAVGGTGADPALTTSTLLGGRSLRFRAGIAEIGDLVDLASTALHRSTATDYREMFRWIDNVRPVDDPDLTHELRLLLVRELTANPETPRIDTILPDDLLGVGDDRAIRYIVFPHEHGTGQGRVVLAPLAVADLLARYGDTDETRETGLDANLRFLDDSADRIGSATVLECLSANLRLADQEFIAYDGDFYSVDRGFAARIDEELSRVPPSTVAYPPYRGQTEPVYNAAVAEDHPDRFVLLDRAEIRLPNEYGVEASDLVASTGALIHVKRKGKSSVLSHLFLQAANSCELLRRSPLAWQQLTSLVRERAKNEEIATGVAGIYRQAAQQRAEIEVAFAFIGDWHERTITSLPLFSRISMVSEVRRVANLGFQPTVALISIR